MTPGWPTTGWQWLRLVGNFANLSTPVGLLVASAGRARIRRGPRGLFLCEGYGLRFPIAGAFTIGSVITTGGTWDAMVARFPKLLEHEETHTWQYLCCLGLPFYPLYAVCMLWSVLRTGDRAAHNAFERHAGLETGGYEDHPTRPVGESLRTLTTKLKDFRRLSPR